MPHEGKMSLCLAAIVERYRRGWAQTAFTAELISQLSSIAAQGLPLQGGSYRHQTLR